MSRYPQPATPLPWKWNDTGALTDEDELFAVHAANAFPHLVAALDAVAGFISQFGNQDDYERIERALALALARGEVMP